MAFARPPGSQGPRSEEPKTPLDQQADHVSWLLGTLAPIRPFQPSVSMYHRKLATVGELLGRAGPMLHHPQVREQLINLIRHLDAWETEHLSTSGFAAAPPPR